MRIEETEREVQSDELRLSDKASRTAIFVFALGIIFFLASIVLLITVGVVFYLPFIILAIPLITASIMEQTTLNRLDELIRAVTLARNPEEKQPAKN